MSVPPGLWAGSSHSTSTSRGVISHSTHDTLHVTSCFQSRERVVLVLTQATHDCLLSIRTFNPSVQADTASYTSPDTITLA